MHPRAGMTPSPGLFPAIFFLSRAARGSWNNHHDRMMLTAIANRVTQVGITAGWASCCCMGARHAARLAVAAAAYETARGRLSRAAFGSCGLSTPLCSCVVAIVRWRRCCRTRGRSLHTQRDLDVCLLGARRRHDVVGDRCPPSVRVSARLCGTLDVAGKGGRGGQNYRFLKLIAIVTLSRS